MARTRGILYMMDGSEHELVLSAGDKLLAKSTTRPKGGDDEDQMLYAAYVAAKREGLPHTDETFEVWAISVADFDPIPSERQIDEMVATGDLTFEQGEGLKRIYGYGADDAAGESVTTPPLSSSTSPSTPDNQ